MAAENNVQKAGKQKNFSSHSAGRTDKYWYYAKQLS